MLVKLLMYHPEMVFRIRIALVVLGIGISGGAILWRILAHGRTLYMIPDHMALRGLAVLMLFPLAGAALLPWNTCDFLDFQAASSLLFLIVGTIIAIRAHKKGTFSPTQLNSSFSEDSAQRVDKLQSRYSKERMIL